MLLILVFIVCLSFVKADVICEGTRIDDLDDDSKCWLHGLSGDTYTWERPNNDYCVFNTNDPVFYNTPSICRNDELSSYGLNYCPVTGSSTIRIVRLKGCNGCNDYTEYVEIGCLGGTRCVYQYIGSPINANAARCFPIKFYAASTYSSLNAITDFMPNDASKISLGSNTVQVIEKNYAYSDLVNVDSSTDYIFLTNINSVSLNQGKAYVSVYQYDSAGNVLKPINVYGSTTTMDHFDAASSANTQTIVFSNFNFKTEPNTKTIKILLQNWHSGAITGNSVFGYVYFGKRSSFTETDCSNGIDDDFDGGADCQDPTGECTSSWNCASLNPTACTTPTGTQNWFIGFWWPSAISGTDQCCGNSPLINGDFEY